MILLIFWLHNSKIVHLQRNKNKGALLLMLCDDSLTAFLTQSCLAFFARVGAWDEICLLHVVPPFCKSSPTSLEEMGCVWKSLLLFLLFPHPR